MGLVEVQGGISPCLQGLVAENALVAIVKKYATKIHYFDPTIGQMSYRSLRSLDNQDTRRQV